MSNSRHLLNFFIFDADADDDYNNDDNENDDDNDDDCNHDDDDDDENDILPEKTRSFPRETFVSNFSRLVGSSGITMS